MATERKYQPYYEGEISLSDSHAECPHCHCVWFADDWNPSDGDTLEVECPQCEKPLQLTAKIRVTIYAAKEISDAN